MQALKCGILSVQAMCATALAGIALDSSTHAAFTVQSVEDCCEGTGTSSLASPIGEVAKVLATVSQRRRETTVEKESSGDSGSQLAALVGGCCATLASLSFSRAAREQLQTENASRALLQVAQHCQSNLTSVHAAATTRRCATALCNISSDDDPGLRKELVARANPAR